MIYKLLAIHNNITTMHFKIHPITGDSGCISAQTYKGMLHPKGVPFSGRGMGTLGVSFKGKICERMPTFKI